MKPNMLASIAAKSVFATFSASADPITYDFDGGAFTTIETGIPADATGITATFTVDLPASNFDPGIDFLLVDYFLSDGLSNISSASGLGFVGAARFATDADGFITDFFISVANIGFGVNSSIVMTFSFETAGVPQFFGNGSESVYCTNVDPASGTCDASVSAFNNQTLPTLTIAQVPEPGTLTLLAIGLLGLGLTRRTTA